jgi:hypothetical protein
MQNPVITLFEKVKWALTPPQEKVAIFVKKAEESESRGEYYNALVNYRLARKFATSNEADFNLGVSCVRYAAQAGVQFIPCKTI